MRALELTNAREALRTREFPAFLGATFVSKGAFNETNQWIAGIVAPLGLGAAVGDAAVR